MPEPVGDVLAHLSVGVGWATSHQIRIRICKSSEDLPNPVI